MPLACCASLVMMSLGAVSLASIVRAWNESGFTASPRRAKLNLALVISEDEDETDSDDSKRQEDDKDVSEDQASTKRHSALVRLLDS